MIGIFRAEKLKIKSTAVSKVWWMAPLILIILTYPLAVEYCIINNFNWFYITILPFMLTLSCVLIGKQEKSKKYQGVLSMPISLKKIMYGKIFVIALGLFLSCILIFAGSVVIQLTMATKAMHIIPVYNMLAAAVILTITFLWQIPVLLFAGMRYGFFVTLIINIVLQMGFSIGAATESWWVLIPYAYPARMMIPVLGILPNGLLAIPASNTYKEELLSFDEIFLALTISILLFAVISIIVGRWFEKREAL